MLFDLSPRVAAAHVDLARPLGAHLLSREKGADAKGRASTALALRAMTHSQKHRLAGHLRAQRAAAAMCDPGHSSNSPGGEVCVGANSSRRQLRFNCGSREMRYKRNCTGLANRPRPGVAVI